jgi:plastocyanin
MGYGSEQPTGEASHGVYRTTPARTGKMLAIILGIMIIGGATFFSMWDYWICCPAPVVAMMAGEDGPIESAVFTGDSILQDLSFIESSDFRTLAFNALPGEDGHNPSIQMNVGDKIVFNVDNAGVSFHSFGVTANDEGFSGVVPGSDIGTASNPLKPGEGGTSEFIAGEEGIFYYICTVPGHRAQGMVGQIIVGDVSAPVMELKVVEEVMEPKVVEEAMKLESTPVEFSGVISIPMGSGAPGCDDTNECYIPFNTSVSAGEEITWSNDDTAPHTVTSGPPGSPDAIFDSGMLMAGDTFSVTLDDSGEYPYYYMVHPWMTGIISVN